MSDANGMRYTYVAKSIEQCATRLYAYESMRGKLGFAPWVARTVDSGEVVGWGGLCLDPNEPEWGLEVIYAFSPTVWGKGFATELVQVSLEHAFGSLSAPAVHAFAHPENAQSVRVLTKCGFRKLRYEPSLQRDHYRLGRLHFGV